MSSQNPASLKEYLSSRAGQVLLGLILIFIFVLIGALPKTIRQQHAKHFAKPLYAHELPSGSRVVQTYAEQSKTDGLTATFATIILQSSLTEDELLAFYSDTDYPPAEKGDTVSLKIYPLQEEALTVLKNNGLYQEDGGSYFYIYLYSSSQADER